MSTLTTNPNKPTVKDLDTKAMQGVDKHLSGVAQLTLLAVTHTPASLKAVFQADIDATNATEAGHTQWRQRVADQKAVRAKTRATRKALKAYLLGVFGPTAVAVLEDFGFSAPKTPGKKTVAAKSAGIVKAAATRVARHTMGTKQRKTVHGAAPAPAPSPTPAGTTPTATTPAPTPPATTAPTKPGT
jgi:hypothetical protein